MKASWDTQVYCLIGDPVAYTLSPVMHNTAFKKLGINGLYLAFRVPTGKLREAVEGMKALGFKGFNVTIPHKVEIIRFLDGLDRLAARIGAVNTVKNDGGRLIGYNTDGEGALRALEEAGVSPKGKNVVVLGAGGASRAICFTIAKLARKLVIANRTEDKALKLAERLRAELGVNVEVCRLLEEELAPMLAEAEILINATSVGMYPEVENSPVSSALLRRDLTVFDIVYKPLKTRLLREAELKGAKTVDGLAMLVHQAARAFEIWTGVTPPVEEMRKAALKEVRQG
ncbi:MAG: shikimate dehydrogenase [Candidatus Hecatellaceae archaeon]